MEVSISNSEKIPPQASEIEAAVLGALLMDSNAYGLIADLISPESFYEPGHSLIYEAIQSLNANNEPIDVLTVAERLRETRNLDRAGGPLYLSELTRQCASTSHLLYHAQVVAQKALGRELIACGNRLVDDAYAEEKDVLEILNATEATLYDIYQRMNRYDIQPISTAIQETIHRIVAASKSDGTTYGVPSGFEELDRLTGGWRKSNLIIIGATSGEIRTHFALTMCRKIIVNFNIPCALITSAMSKEEVANQLLADCSAIEVEKLKKGQLSEDEWTQLEKTISTLIDTPLYVDDSPCLSLYELRDRARKIVREYGVKILIVNDLRKNYSTDSDSNFLKDLARELDIPVIVLPHIALRDAVYEHADVECFIHQIENVKTICISKNRNGATGSIVIDKI